MNYPHTRIQEHVDELHGIRVPDPYRWLEELDSTQTRLWIEAQNKLTFDYLATIPARELIAQRARELWDFEKYTLPRIYGGRYFFTCNDGLQNQAILYWLSSLDAQAKILLDPNALSEDGTVALNWFEPSPDGRYIAYSISSAGSDWQTWRIRAVDNGEDLEDCIEWSKFSTAAWTKDNQGFFYSCYDAPKESQVLKSTNFNQKLYYHHLGSSQAEDRLVYQRPDEKEWGFGAQVSDDGRYLVISVWKGTFKENNIFYQDLTAPIPVVELLTGFEAHFEYFGNQGNSFYFLTDLNAPNSRIISIDITRPQREYWHEIVAESPDALTSANLVGGRIIAVYLKDAYSLTRQYTLAGELLGEIPLPGIGTVLGFGGKFEDKETFYQFTNFVTPGTVYRYDLEKNQSTIFRQPRVKFNGSDYEVGQVFFPGKDGIRIPMFLCHKKGIKLDGQNPTYLYGYGGFNIPVTPAFSVGAMVWMEMGGVYAVANLRGGGEYGNAWYDAGRLKNKQNVFNDFIAAAEFLIADGITNPKRLAIGGRSNGGLLIGACMTQRPELFGACLPVVGVMDMLRFHKFTIGWAWVSDYGSPDDPDDFKVLLRYSPYHNIRPGTVYPPTLVCTGDHDDRVFPAHSFKFAAALQVAQAGSAPVLIRIETRAGHGMGKPTYKLIDELVDQWAFLVKNLDMHVDNFTATNAE